MERITIYFTVAVLVISIIGTLLHLNRRNRDRPAISPLRAMAFVVILSSLNFGPHSIAVYVVLGFGLLLILVDLVRTRQSKIKTGKLLSQ